MTDEQRVYIRGVDGRGDEILEVLEGLGAKRDVANGNDSNYIYFIRHDGYIDLVGVGSEFAKIIEDDYTEIKLPEKWRDGDLLVCHMLSGNRYAVYSDDSERMVCNTITTYVDVDNYTYGINGLFDKEDFTLASDEEHEEFYVLLHKHGKDWDAEKKQLVNFKWKPEYHEDYFFITTDLYVSRTTNDGLPIDKDRINCGNCFRTSEEAEVMAAKIKKLLNAKS